MVINSDMQPTALSIQQDEDPQELVRFRAEWLAELESRKTTQASGNAQPGGSNHAASASGLQQSSNSKASSKTLATSAAVPQVLHGPATQTIAGAPSAFATHTPSVHFTATLLPRKLGSALNVYRQAVEHEQHGALDDALLLYRQAFRMDAHVDRAYHREEILASVSAARQEPHYMATDIPVDALTARVEHSLALKSQGGVPNVRVTGTLANILQSFPVNLSFEPEIEEEPIHLKKVPEEVLVMIIRKLDPTSTERFASVSRKARVITLDSAIWRELVRATYKPPQVADVMDVTLVLERCLYDYRRVYIEHPRVRLDGVYIATCHYVRPGLSENSWVNISHLITYHRYLRFFPNGQVLSLLANEEHTPQQVIPLLKPTLRMKGFYIGVWRLSGTTIQLFDLLDASGRFSHPVDVQTAVPQNLHNHGNESTEGLRYTFAMTLGLVSRPLGRWNKMNIEAYNSVNLETGDIEPVALKHERPFWFSKVRSYNLN